MKIRGKEGFGRPRRLVSGLGLVVLIVMASGCATSRGILDVRISPSSNPSSGKAVTIVSVSDQRQFELRPNNASIPSLKNGEISDSTITDRAIARKRNGYGKALGDILLPEGRTVQALTREALTRAFREAGYRVLEKGDKDFGNAAPVHAEIEQFWAWITPGFWAAALEFETRVKLTGNIESLSNGESVRGYVRLKTQTATGSRWLNTINKGLQNFINNVKNVI